MNLNPYLKMDDISPPHLSNLLQVTRKFDGTVAASSPGDMNLMHWNINHLTNKLNQVEVYVAIFPSMLDVVAKSETWLTPLNFLTFKLHGYRETHSVRQDKTEGQP